MRAPGAVTISTFASLKPLLRRIVLRVHPDVIQQLPPACAKLNAASLQTLFRLFDSLRARLPEPPPPAPQQPPPPPPPPTPQPLLERYPLSFWFEPRATADDGHPGAAAAEPVLLRREVRPPTDLERRCAQLVSAGRPAAAAAQWLSLGAGTLAELGEGLGLCARGAVQLSPELRAALLEGEAAAPDQQRQQQQKRAQPMDPLTATQALRAHLAAHSPLQQGKAVSPGAATLAAAQALVADGRSVFSPAQRRRRVEGLLAAPGWLEVSPAGVGSAAGSAAIRLRASLVAHFDALHLYQGLWPSLRLRLSLQAQPTQFYCDASTGTLHLPASYGEAELVHFVRRSWPALTASQRLFAAAPRARKARSQEHWQV